jgi:hypothetical protein
MTQIVNCHIILTFLTKDLTNNNSVDMQFWQDVTKYKFTMQFSPQTWQITILLLKLCNSDKRLDK